MTQAQERAVQRVKRMAENSLFHGGPEKYEFKQFEVTDHEWGTVSVALETGMKGDEGTLAAIFARDYCHIFIGPRGAIYWYDKKCVEKRLAKERTILAAVIQQR